MRATGRKNPVQHRPKLAGKAGGRARVRNIRSQVASFPKTVLTALNIGYCPGIEDDPNVLIEALTIREADISTNPSGTTILGSVTAKEIHRARTLVALRNSLGRIGFAGEPRQQLPFYIAHSVMRLMANKIIQGNRTGGDAWRRSLRHAKKIAVEAIGALRFNELMLSEEDEKPILENLQLAKDLILSFDPDSVSAAALSRLRRCEYRQCPKPYFIERSIRRAKFCPTHSK